MVNITLVGYLVTLSLIALEFFKYRGVVSNYFLLQAWQFVILFLVGIGILKFGQFLSSKKRKFVPPQLRSLNNSFFDIPNQLSKINSHSVLPISLIASIILFGIEAYTYTNYIFSTLGINHFALTEMLLLSFVFFLLTASKKTYKDYWPIFIFSGFLLYCFFLFNYHYELFLRVSSNMGGAYDDNFMEWLQVWVLAFGALITGILAFISKKNSILLLLYLVATLVLIGLIGEEISWGARLFDIPIQISESNYQNEFNLHNQPFFNEISALLYPFAFIYAICSWIAYKIALKKEIITIRTEELWQFFSFRGNEIIFFVPTLIVNPYSDRTIIRGFPPLLDMYHNAGLIPEFYKTLHFLAYWRESLEVLFYLGLTIHFLQIIYIKIKKLKKIGVQVPIFTKI